MSGGPSTLRSAAAAPWPPLGMSGRDRLRELQERPRAGLKISKCTGKELATGLQAVWEEVEAAAGVAERWEYG